MQETVSESFSTQLSERIPRPSDDRPPLRTNVFEFAQTANTTLAPLFPYLQAGAIVPGAALFVGGPGTDYGHFFHENTEEEVGLVLAGRGAVRGPGSVMVNPLLHGVKCYIKEPEDPANFLLLVITQRQAENRAQTERVFFRCGCNEVLFEWRFDSTPALQHDVHANGIFKSTQESNEAALAFNRDESARTCKRCGKVSPPFPLDLWGWRQHSAFYRAAAEARRVFEGAAAQPAAAP